MSGSARRLVLVGLTGLLLAGCSQRTLTGADPDCTTSLALLRSSVPDLTGQLESVFVDSGNTPAGPRHQHNLWLTMAPATAPNAGVVVGRATPVFLQRGSGAPVPVTACDLAAGDSLVIWHDGSVAYGSVEGPPGAPGYFATQVLVIRPQFR
ncbi:MAG: hypothetical protein ABI765_00045 [Gemmatimonadota bacterium]